MQVKKRIKLPQSRMPFSERLAMSKKQEWEKNTPQKERFRIYQRMVRRLSENEEWESLKDSDKRGFTDHHMDHKISIFYGFKNNLPPCFIAGRHNLRFVPHEENIKKGHNCILP